jgi:hypothetical protein
MSSRQKRITSAIALFLVFSITQVYVGVSFAGPQPTAAANENSLPAPQQTTGILSTQGNKPITVNGATAASGATLVSGASIETPVAVGATANLRNLGSLQIDPNAKLTLEFQNGSVKVMLLQGCVTLHTRKGVSGEIDTSQGVAGKTDPAKDGLLKVCTPGSDRAPAVRTTGGLFGLGTAATIAIIGGGATAVILPIIIGGGNSSPQSP